MIRTPVIERLMRRVVIDDDTRCWVWQGAVSQTGYGRIGEGGTSKRTLSTHRLSYEHHVGQIPDGLELDHTCSNRRCCNPDHLEPVTHAENLRRGQGSSARAVRTGRCHRGHSLDDALMWDGKRTCRTCRKLRRRKHVRR